LGTECGDEEDEYLEFGIQRFLISTLDGLCKGKMKKLPIVNFREISDAKSKRNYNSASQLKNIRF